jgi:hypothetical protein
VKHICNSITVIVAIATFFSTAIASLSWGNSDCLGYFRLHIWQQMQICSTVYQPMFM